MILAKLGRPCLQVATKQSWVIFFSADAPYQVTFRYHKTNFGNVFDGINPFDEGFARRLVNVRYTGQVNYVDLHRMTV